jgi:hypothetical protein
MTVPDEIAASITEFAPVYLEIHSLLKELEKLEQAELVQAEYTRQTSQFNEELALLTKRKKELESPLAQTLVRETGAKPFVPLKVIPTLKPVPHSEKNTTPVNSARQPIQRTRAELQKFINRWGYDLKISGETRGRINRIANDPSRPLGEALALLDWSAFTNRIGSEGDKEHLARLDSWGGALFEYKDRLAGEIDMLQIKYRLLMPILDAWIQRDTRSGLESWDKQIAETNAAKEKEVERLRDEIARLTERA